MLHDDMSIKLKAVPDNEFNAPFEVAKEALYPFVDAVFGWSDDFQRARIKNEYQPQWFSWIYHDKERIGLLCCKPYENAIHVHLLIVFLQFQNRGFGEMVMRSIHSLAEIESKKYVTLSSFKINELAICFYNRLGYGIVESDDDFVSLSLHIEPENGR